MRTNVVKKVLCLVLSLAVIMAMMPAVFASDPQPELDTPGLDDVTVTISGTVKGADGNPAQKEVTVLVLRPGVTVQDIAEYDPETDSREPIELISYIDQITSESDGTFAFEYNLGADPEEGTYTVLVGGTDIEVPSVSTFTVSGGTTPTIKYGDVNDSGDINITDAVLVMQAIVGSHEFTAQQAIAADVNLSQDINITDAVLIMQYIVGAQDELPVIAN